MYQSVARTMEWGDGRRLDFDISPLVMGIVNVTPDSFYPGSRKEKRVQAVCTALEMEAAGAAIIDIGGESSRPGSDYVGEKEELERVVPVIEEIRRRSNVVISLDTRKASVAEKGLSVGADMINDISALRDDPELASLVSQRDIPVVLMHMRGTPKNMQKEPFYDDVIGEITDELQAFAQQAENAGISSEKIIIDPGIGFGKRYSDNLLILQRLSVLKQLGYPLLVGLSRKSFLGRVLSEPAERNGERVGRNTEPVSLYEAGAVDKQSHATKRTDRSTTGRQAHDRPVEDRLEASVAAHVYCAMQGVDILRVHDVRETVDAVTVLRAITSA